MALVSTNGHQKRRPGRPRKYESPEVMEPLIERYFASCREKGDFPLVTGLALALNMTLDGFRDYCARPEFAALLKKARQRCADEVAKAAIAGRCQQIFAIFYLKAQHGWREEQHVSVAFPAGEQTKEPTLEEALEALRKAESPSIAVH